MIYPLNEKIILILVAFLIIIYKFFYLHVYEKVNCHRRFDRFVLSNSKTGTLSITTAPSDQTSTITLAVSAPLHYLKVAGASIETTQSNTTNHNEKIILLKKPMFLQEY
jgi:hypothetical protein